MSMKVQVHPQDVGQSNRIAAKKLTRHKSEKPPLKVMKRVSQGERRYFFRTTNPNDERMKHVIGNPNVKSGEDKAFFNHSGFWAQILSLLR